MNKKCIVFDLDGTLLDTKYDLLNAVNHIRRNYKLNNIDVKELYKHIGRGMRVLVDEAIDSELSIENRKNTYDSFISYYNQHSLDNTKPFINVKETLIKLKEKGYILAVVSNKNDKEVKKIIDFYFYGMFDYVIGALDNIPKKPNPDLVYMALDNLKCSKDESIYIGDSKFDLLTALNSGLDHVLVTYGYATSKDEIISLGGKLFIDDFKELLDIL